jgi:membrane protein DedA with SNARE-associated domain
MEYAGAPVASVPVLVLAGAAAASGLLDPVYAVLAAAAGGLIADAGWFTISWWRGCQLVDRVCGLTSNPAACTRTVNGRLERIGPAYIIPSKFLPGTGNLIAASAGTARVSPAVFLASDALALLAWATVYVTIGFLFAEQVEAAMSWVLAYARVSLIVAVVLVAGAAGWRTWKAVMHAAAHRKMDGDVEEARREREGLVHFHLDARIRVS